MMRAARNWILAGLTAAVACAVQPSLADTPLKRLTLRQDLLGFEAVGRLDLGDGFCSASLIAPDLVLTAAHCLVDVATGKRRDPRRAMFRAGIRDGVAIAERSGARAVVHPDYDPGDADFLRKLASDIAILQLAEPIPSGVAAPFAVDAAPRSGATVSVVSYARDRDAAPSWQHQCDLLRQAQGAMEMTCDVNFGSSGAPVFDLSSGRPRIVSVVSQKVTTPGESRMLGMVAAESVGMLKAALRSGRGVWPKEAPTTARRLTVGGGGAMRSTEGGARFVRP